MAPDGDATDNVDQPTANVIPSFSFSGCGFLGVYHVGVAACLRDHTDVVNRREIKFAGSSAGAIVATTLLCDINFGEMTKLLLLVAKAVRDKESVDLGILLRDLMNHYLPDDAHIRLRNRLYISVTVLSGLEGTLITDFQSKEHLIDCLIASSFVPGFIGWIPPLLDGNNFVDTSNGKHTKPVSVTEESISTDGDRCAEQQKLPGNPQQPSTVIRSVFETDSVWGVLCSDHECMSLEEKKKMEIKKMGRTKESYLRMLMRLCFLGWRTTSEAVHKLPGASQIIDRVMPQIFTELDGFVEALVMEMMSNRYAVFDGGFSDNIPSFDSNTITICPFSGESDICPRDITGLDFNIDLAHTSMQASEDNIFRLNHALSPMDAETLLKLCEEGYNECLRFLNKKDLLSCKKHLMTRAAISPSPCNIGHAHCHCPLCKSLDSRIRLSLSCINCQRTKQKALISVLPEDVRKEFYKAIEQQKQDQSMNRVHHSYWSKVITALWWCAEKMYSNTLHLSDLALDFSAWLLRFWDNIASFTRFAVLPLGKKKKLVRHILSSLRQSISVSIRLRAGNQCTVKSVPSLCS